MPLPLSSWDLPETGQPAMGGPVMGQPAMGQPVMGQPDPHVVELEVLATDIDAYEHVNNSVYLSWLDRAAWSHSAKLGVSLERCISMRRGMAAHRTEIDYVRAAVLGDRVFVGTWIVSTDRRLRVERRFQVRRAPVGELLARARIDYVCINLDSGRAARMPELFQRAYVPGSGQPDRGELSSS